MTRPRHTKPRHGTPTLPKKTAAILANSAERMKVRMLLSNGATPTPIGAVTYLRMEGSELVQEFPTELVDLVMFERAARAAASSEAGAALEGQDDA